MKKIKLFLPVLLALVVVFALSLTACKKKGKEVLQSIEITSEPYRTEFILGEEFSAAGIEVTADFGSSKKLLTAEEYDLDSSAYKANKEGTYTIKISYTYNEVTAETSYDVTVSLTVFEGIDVALAEDYTLISNMYLSMDYVIVREVDKEGVVIETPLDSSEYTLKVYLGTTEIAISDGTALLNQKGTYQIWAFKDSSIVEGYVLSDFVLLTV